MSSESHVTPFIKHVRLVESKNMQPDTEKRAGNPTASVCVCMLTGQMSRSSVNANQKSDCDERRESSTRDPEVPEQRSLIFHG